MTHRTDDKYAYLVDQGIPAGNASDMVLAWLKSLGATSEHISDAWWEVLIAAGYTSGNRNDRWYQMLGDLGLEGNLADREAAFWKSGPVFPAGYFHDFTTGTLTGWTFARASHSYVRDSEGGHKYLSAGDAGFVGSVNDDGIQ